MDDTKWFIGFLLIFGIIWLSGKSTATRRASEHASSTPQAQVVPAKPSSQAKPKKAESLRVPASTVISESELPGGVLPEVSPLRGKLTISTVNRGVVEKEYVIIRASTKNTSDINITGLTLRSGVSLNGQTIGKGWSMFYPTNEGTGDPILLRPGGRVYLLSGHSPLGQAVPLRGGFQLNLCTGYMEQGRTFYPSLPRECPRPKDGPLPLPPNQLSDDCYDYLGKVPRCVVLSSVPKNLESDGSCRAYLFNRINYNQCVTDYKNAPNFFKGEWRVYFGRSTRLWRDKREIVELVDVDGKLIDSRRYGY
ncbi:MAG: hypothetical protein Q7R64_01955 [bacterium]|nr:hypothetical protein [bacterium]